MKVYKCKNCVKQLNTWIQIKCGFCDSTCMQQYEFRKAMHNEIKDAAKRIDRQETE